MGKFGNGRQERPRKQGEASCGTGGTAARTRYACLFTPRKIAGTSRGCTFLHRKACKVIHTQVCCLRVEDCAYLHPVEEDPARKTLDQNDINQFEEMEDQDDSNQRSSKNSKLP